MSATESFNPEATWVPPDRRPAILRPSRRLGAASLAYVLLVALFVGLGSAYLSVEKGELFGALRLGLWEAFPDAGTPEADPYSAAMYARTGRIPLAGGEGLAFLADSDSAGRPLDPACDYRIFGKTAPSRLWTLVSMNREFRLVATVAGRAGLSSHHLLRRPDGSFEITAAPYARPGNWLPTAPIADGLVFVLRLYDTPLTTGTGIANVDMPDIVRERCR
ncbi:DUF1214 domain-containing protein [Stappia sediminis]|uniref:DUF1214 domain-containing protein n=1 Tax=Stappia sediminis TaxID=2692190 RepID=UPI001925A09A|nr:DUF1214 domain-containing protein [Stappia sediminis]